METVTLALDDTNQTLEDEEMQSLASSDAGLILYQEESDDWSIEYFEDTEELADRWGEWQDEARSAYGQLMGFDEEEI